MQKSQVQNNMTTLLKIKEPPKYNVILHNDDVTTMDFVIFVLHSIFRKSLKDAEVLMMKVHNEGSAVAGTYTKDIAESKVKKSIRLARANNFPLELTTEEVL